MSWTPIFALDGTYWYRGIEHAKEGPRFRHGDRVWFTSAATGRSLLVRYQGHERSTDTHLVVAGSVGTPDSVSFWAFDTELGPT